MSSQVYTNQNNNPVPIRLVTAGSTDHNPPALKRKTKQENCLLICTYNTRTLASTEKMLDFKNAIETINYDVIGLSEIRRQGYSIEEDETHIFCYYGETQGHLGVGFLLRKKYKINIMSFVGLSERVAVLNLRFENQTMSIIQVHAPTSASPDEDIETFYHTIEQAQLISEKKQFIIGDFNAITGIPKKEENFITGDYGSGVRNKRGHRLIQFATENKLTIVNTLFHKNFKQRWTWISPDKNTKNEIDYILTTHSKTIRNYEVLTPKFPSDHRLLRTTVMVSNQKVIRRKFQKPLPHVFKNEEDSSRYKKKLQENICA
ncbi:craniofacial development protein 2-like [Cydia strobilella]|uniref:craniofacial development protein 2-like n=1 Tax=Cydia strobilella TaxID=1100964 RepID=UPI00300405D5